MPGLLLRPLTAVAATMLVASGVGAALAGAWLWAAGPGDAAVHAEPVVVRISQYAFQPPQLAVTPGTTVTWVNQDAVPHTATGADDRGWDSGLLRAGQTWSHTFDVEGTYSYFCIPHPQMGGRVEVERDG